MSYVDVKTTPKGATVRGGDVGALLALGTRAPG